MRTPRMSANEREMRAGAQRHNARESGNRMKARRVALAVTNVDNDRRYVVYVVTQPSYVHGLRQYNEERANAVRPQHMSQAYV